MLDFKKIFSFEYHPKLLEMFVSMTLLSVFIANVVTPILVSYIFYDVVPHSYLSIWLFLHLLVFLGRIFSTKRLRYFLEKKHQNTDLCLKIIFMLTLTTTVLYGLAVWSSLLYNASDLQIFGLSVLIVSLSAGALATLINIYQLYVLFVVLSMVPLMMMLLYHDREIFDIIAFILFIFTTATLRAGYKQYLALNNVISLEETFQTIYDKSSDGIALIQNNRFKDCNESIVQMFQYSSKEELMNTHFSKLMPKKQPDGSLSVVKMLKMAKITMQNGTNSFEWLYTNSKGELFWTDVVLTKIYLNKDELIHGVWRDITDRKKLERDQEISKKRIEELNQSLESRVKQEVEKNREKDQLMLSQSRLAQKGEMLSMIAHQWRQPLAAISATSASIEMKAGMNKLDNDDIKQKARAISDYSEHLSQTINDFKSFFKPNKKKTETTYDDIITSALQIMENSLNNKNIQLHKNLNCHETFISYPNKIKQVILNLISNAEDALLESKVPNPSITITTYTKENKNIFEIIDNAGGVPEDIIEKIFDPYFSTKISKDGTGLGLYMSKVIIQEHCNGTLSVENIKNGALFRIILTRDSQKKGKK